MTIRKQKKDSTSVIWISTFFGGLLLLWLVLSVLFDKSPRHILKDVYQLGTGNLDRISKNDHQCEAFLKEKEKTIDSLHEQMKFYASILPSASAVVYTDGSGLNMRAVPDLNGEVLIKIPDSTRIEIIFADPESKNIDGFDGQWVKAKYKNVKGWLWSRYLKFDATN